MVKGTSKRVVVVKSPDPRFFEQAIFILREDLKAKGGSDVLREAQRVADDYVKSYAPEPRKLLSRIPPALLGALGAAAGATVSLLICFLL